MQLVFEDQTKLIVLHCNKNQEDKKSSSRSPSPTQAASTQTTSTTSSMMTQTPSVSPLPQQLELQASTSSTFTLETVSSINQLHTYEPSTSLGGSVSLPTVTMDVGQPTLFSDLLYPPFDVNSAEFVSSMEDLVNIIFCQQPNLCLGYNWSYFSARHLLFPPHFFILFFFNGARLFLCSGFFTFFFC